VVGGYYTDTNFSMETTDITVSQYLPGMLTGGGYTVNNASGTATVSSGQYAGDAGLNTNFGFNAKTTKNGGFQGNVNVIVRKGGHVYQIKSNNITSIGSYIPASGTCSATTPCTGTFLGGANIQDVTNPSNPISVMGGGTIQITMTDRGDPGSSDSVAITVYDKNNVLDFSNNWNGSKTVEQTLNGGNLVVH
jgi:hypothetical protein